MFVLVNLHPTPPHKQESAQDNFFAEINSVEFTIYFLQYCLLYQKSSLPYYLLITGIRMVDFLFFQEY